MKNESSNPLHSPQKEKAGARTYSQYAYQYNWALYKAVQDHEHKNEYAIFLELHEDVVFANSLNSSKARFKFCQVKTTKTKFNEDNLSKPRKQKKDSSVLGKLLDNCLNKKYSSAIDEIILVAANGFNFSSLKNSLIQKEKICITDFTTSAFDEIEKKIKTELSCSELPSNIYFIVPSLPITSFQENVIGQISTLINKLFPESNFNPVDVYRTLIDELNRKGTNIFDYEKWEDALEKKALTSSTVERVINTFTKHKNEHVLNQEFNQIALELQLNSINKRSLKQAFNRYKTKAIGARNTLQIKLTQEIRGLISLNISTCNGKIEDLISLVSSNLSKIMQENFHNQTDLEGAIIYEYITSQDDE